MDLFLFILFIINIIFIVILIMNYKNNLDEKLFSNTFSVKLKQKKLIKINDSIPVTCDEKQKLQQKCLAFIDYLNHDIANNLRQPFNINFMVNKANNERFCDGVMSIKVYPQTNYPHTDNLVSIVFYPKNARYLDWRPDYFFVIGNEYASENIIIPDRIDKDTVVVNLLESIDFMVILLTEINNNNLKCKFKKKQQEINNVLQGLI